VAAVVAVDVVVEEPIMKNTSIARSLIALGLLCAAVPATVFAQAVYKTPDEAAAALIAAAKSNDEAARAKIFGPSFRSLIPAGDIDREDVDAFVKMYDDSHRIKSEGDKAWLAVGPSDFTFAVPMVKGASGWSFDLKAGQKEVLARQIGRNENAAIQAVLAYRDAQFDYAEVDRNKDGIREYAQKFFSSEGKQDGLYWPTKASEPQSPLGPLFAEAPKEGVGFHGYHYRILTAQGPSAPGGAYDYVVGGRMRNGFAIIAWPVRWGETGIMTFMTSHDGEVFQKNVGQDSAAFAEKVTKFDPDDSWTEVSADDEKPEGATSAATH
jgi:hypothetical protein